MKKIIFILITIILLFLGCASRQNSTDLAVGGAVAVDQVEEIKTEGSEQEQDEKSEIKTPDQTKEPVEKSALRYACPNGSWVTNPNDCLNVAAGKNDVLIFE